MFGFALLTKFGIVIILQFDGSLRPPRDPGCATLPARMATCSSRLAFCAKRLPTTLAVPLGQNASLGQELATTLASVPYLDLLPTTDDQSTQQPNQKLVTDFVGGRLLPLTMGMTSAHAEYEGLLLGLEMLLELQSRGSGTNPAPFNLEHRTSSFHLPQPEGTSDYKTDDAVLIIQGDCKTVIEQLSGRSLSRKLRECYEVAQERINRLQQDREAKQRGNVDSRRSTFRIRQVQFQHIPRKQNIVCDAICGLLMFHICRNAERSLRQGIAYQMQYLQHKESVPREKNPNTVSVKTLLDHYFSAKCSRIRYSARPGLYRSLSLLALKRKEWNSLYEIGTVMVEEAKVIWAPNKKLQNGNQLKDEQEMMLKLGIQCQLVGLEGLEQRKEAASFRHKNRFLLQSSRVKWKGDSQHSSSELSASISNICEKDMVEINRFDLDDSIPGACDVDMSIPQIHTWVDKARSYHWLDDHDQEQHDNQQEAHNTLWIQHIINAG